MDDFTPQSLRKYFIMGSQNCSRNPLDMLEAALKAGITMFQFREKGPNALTGRKKLELGFQMRELCAGYQVPFIVNDDYLLAEKLEADGIHIGQDDIPLDKLRMLFPEKIIGLSISNKQELIHSPIELADYIGAGPVFSTDSKHDAKEAVGTEWITYIRHVCPAVPLVGIGGITTENAQAVLNAGANGVSIISAITTSANIQKTVQYL